MINVIIAFGGLDGLTPEQMITGNIKLGYKYLSTHMVFDIQTNEKFTNKDCLVYNGHKMDAPASITYSSVVSKDNIRISFLIESLNYLCICLLISSNDRQA